MYELPVALVGGPDGSGNSVDPGVYAGCSGCDPGAGYVG